MTQKVSEATKPMKCSCPSPYQDAKYGKGIRVHNKCLKPVGAWRCTVCGLKN